MVPPAAPSALHPPPFPEASSHRGPVGVGYFLTRTDLGRFFSGEGSLVEKGSEGEWLEPGTTATSLASLNPEVLVTAWETPPLPAEWLASPDCRLRYVCHVTGSVRRLVPRSFIERGGLVTNWGAAVAASVAEHALLLCLGALREQGFWRDMIGQAPGQRRVPRTRPLAGRRVGLHGFGGIARKLAQLLQPFGVELRAFSAGVPPEMFAAHGVQAAASLGELFDHSEILFECEALTPATAGSVTEAMLARLPDDAVFVNVGRGRVVDEAALVKAAQAGRLRVAVDVMADEPATEQSPLCRVPGVLVSPHVAGPTTEEYVRLGAAALANVRRYRAGLPLADVVSLDLYDRST